MTDPVNALDNLVAMRERGLITEEEFQERRARLLDGLEPERRPQMTDWKGFALLIFALVLAVIVWFVFQAVKGGLDRMV